MTPTGDTMHPNAKSTHALALIQTMTWVIQAAKMVTNAMMIAMTLEIPVSIFMSDSLLLTVRW
jgi:hypothetical protein